MQRQQQRWREEKGRDIQKLQKQWNRTQMSGQPMVGDPAVTGSVRRLLSFSCNAAMRSNEVHPRSHKHAVYATQAVCECGRCTQQARAPTYLRHFRTRSCLSDPMTGRTDAVSATQQRLDQHIHLKQFNTQCMAAVGGLRGLRQPAPGANRGAVARLGGEGSSRGSGGEANRTQSDPSTGGSKYQRRVLRGCRGSRPSCEQRRAPRGLCKKPSFQGPAGLCEPRAPLPSPAALEPCPAPNV